jgi:O-antigen/teichoic acid export membrane protein
LGGLLFYTFVSLLSNEITTHILINDNLRFLPKLVVLSGVIYALIKIISESFKAKNKVSIGLAIEFVFPLMFLFIIVTINRFFNHKILISELIQFHLVIGLVIMVVSILFLFYRNNFFLKFDLSWLKINNIRTLLTPIKFWLILLLNNLLSIGPYLILPVYVSETEIGYFSIAHRFVGIVATIMFALSSNFGPQFSKYSSENNLGNLIRKFRLSQKYCLFFCIPLLVLYLLFPSHIIKIYGPDFMPALPLLLIMASGRILISFLGLTESFLNMTGHEKWELLSTGISVILFLFLIAIKISNDAVIGITWAFTIALSFKSLFSYIIIFNYSHANQ